jgi:hypothetical protein
MNLTVVRQDCTALTDDSGKATYTIALSVEESGRLPHKNIFVYRVTRHEEPGDDEFVRIAEVSDMNTQAMNRNAAINSGRDMYLSIYHERHFSQIEEAIETKNNMRLEINRLVNMWESYDLNFKSNEGDKLYFPTMETQEEALLIEEYKEARNVRIAAEQEVAEAELEVHKTQATRDVRKEQRDAYSDAYTSYSALYNGSGGSIINYHIAVVSPSGYSNPNADLIWTTVENQLNSTHNLLQPLVLQSAVAYTDAEVMLEESVKAKKEANAELTAAQTAEDKALAAVLAVNPDYVPY